MYSDSVACVTLLLPKKLKVLQRIEDARNIQSRCPVYSIPFQNIVPCVMGMCMFVFGEVAKRIPPTEPPECFLNQYQAQARDERGQTIVLETLRSWKILYDVYCTSVVEHSLNICAKADLRWLSMVKHRKACVIPELLSHAV